MAHLHLLLISLFPLLLEPLLCWLWRAAWSLVSPPAQNSLPCPGRSLSSPPARAGSVYPSAEVVLWGWTENRDEDKIKALARKPELFLRYWPHLVEHDNMCWAWQHDSALGNLAQQAQKINNARKAICKPGLQLFAGCRTEKSHTSTTKPNPKNSHTFFHSGSPPLFQADFTFQSSHFRIGQLLFNLRLTRDSFIFISIPGQETRLNYYRNTPRAPPAPQEQLSALHGVHCVLNDLYPAIALLFGAGMDFHHLGILPTHADQEQSLLFVSHFSYNQLLQRDHSGFLVLQMERNGWGGGPELAPRFKLALKRSQ